MIRSRLAAAIALVSFLLSACTHYEPLSLHGAGSMRVEVEVYKGPVTLSADAQIGQTASVMSDFVRAMDKWHDEVAQTLNINEYADTNGRPAALPPPVVKAEYITELARKQPEQEEAQNKDYEERVVTYKRAKAFYDAEWSEHQRRFQSARKVDGPSGEAFCTAYPQTRGGGRLSADDWRDCNAVLTAYQSSERVISFACYIMHTPPFEQIAPMVFLPERTCNEERYKRGWKYLYEPNPRTHADNTKFIPAPRSDPASPDSGSVPQKLNETTYYDGMNKIWNDCNKPPLTPTQTTKAFAACHESIVMAMESLTTMLRSTAFRVADANIRHVPRERNFRGLLVTYAYVASQYGDQMSSRVAVLRKELADTESFSVYEGGDIRALLPTSDYLRGAGYSDFVHLYDWLKATDPGQPGKLDTRARVRMAERLSNDYYWEKVNEVYASGQGDVSMAFVKDAIGNWGLKSFSNDPSKLLAAYRKVADASLNAAAKLATRAASGGGIDALATLTAAQKAASFAHQAAGGDTAATNAPDLSAMRARIVSRIQARGQVFADRETKASADVAAIVVEIAQLKNSGGDESAISAATGRKKAADERLLAVRKDAIQAFGDIMDDQAQVLLTMQEALAPIETASPAK